MLKFYAEVEGGFIFEVDAYYPVGYANVAWNLSDKDSILDTNKTHYDTIQNWLHYFNKKDLQDWRLRVVSPTMDQCISMDHVRQVWREEEKDN